MWFRWSAVSKWMVNFHFNPACISLKRRELPTTSQFIKAYSFHMLDLICVMRRLTRSENCWFLNLIIIMNNVCQTWRCWLDGSFYVDLNSLDLLNVEYYSRFSKKKTALKLSIIIADPLLSSILSVFVLWQFKPVSSWFEYILSFLAKTRRLHSTIALSHEKCIYFFQENGIFHQLIVMNDVKSKMNLKPSD